MPTFAASSIRLTTSGCCEWWRAGIADPRILRLIRQWLEAGILESDEWHETDRGTPQGAGISPLLANIFLHYALDLWVHQWRRRHARGRVSIVRYADDFVMGFENAGDARRMLADLKDRLAKFGLSLHEDKTRLIAFGRLPAMTRQHVASGVRKPSPSSASPIIAGGPGTAGSS